MSLCEMPMHSRESASRKDCSQSRGLLSSISSPPPLLVAAADHHRNPPSGGSDGSRCITQGEADADYELFLEHLRLDGKSYVFEINVGAGSPLRVKYEEDEPRCHAAESSRKGTGEAKRGRKRKDLVPNPNEGLNLFTPLHLSGLDIGGSLVDTDYLLFLNHVKVRGGSMILEWRDNLTIIYEKESEENEDTQQQEQVEVLEIEVEELREEAIGMEGGENGTCLESEEYSYLTEILQHKPSLFRSRLMSVLKKPFDQKEYENMMSLFKHRTPVMNFKHLRDESIAYPTDRLGSSYLDHFPDLARRIDSAFDDNYQKDMLLRGFFFWLKNLSYTEAFKPWVPALPDSSYVTLNPSNGKKVLVIQIDD